MSSHSDEYWHMMEQIRLRVKYDVAWRIFDEVNEKNDTFRHIDLTNLDYDDAVMISKKKILELSRHAQIQSGNMYNAQENWILNIKCADDHFIVMEDDQGRTPLKNCILEMIKCDLDIEHYFISTRNMILVRIDKDTLSKLEELQ